MSATHQRIVLASRPKGVVTPENFRLEQVPRPQPGPGEVLVRNHYLSLDPYMRGRMEESKSYAEPQKVGETMIGGTVGVVETSNHAGLVAGDTVVGLLGWQEYGVVSGRQLMKVDTRAVPMSAYLGPVGMPGVTAWYGLNRICEPKPGETVLVSAASGAVGSVVGQLAKQAGLPRDRHCRRAGKVRVRGIGARLRCVPRSPAVHRREVDGPRAARGGSAGRRRTVRERRRSLPRCRTRLHESVRAHRAVRLDRRLRGTGHRDPQTCACCS